MSPGRLGIVGKWDEATISKICEDVHADLKGKAEPGWIFHAIDDKPFYLNLLKKKAGGRFNYKITFKTGVINEFTLRFILRQ